MKEASRYESLRDYLRVLRDQWWVIILLALVGGGAALAISLRQDELYEATSSISFETNTQELSSVGGGSVGIITPPDESPQARAATLEKRAFLVEVRKQLPRPQPSVETLQGAISSVVDSKSLLVNVTASWGDPKFAAELANVFSRVAVNQINDDARSGYESSKEAVKRRIERLPDTGAEFEAGALTEQFTRLQFLAANTTPASLAESAEPSDSPVSPKPARDVPLGVLLGLIVGVLVAFLRDSLDRRLRDAAEIEAELHYPLIGHVRNNVLGRVVRADADGGTSAAEELEAFRILRQNLEFLAVDSTSKVILVTSALAEEGKSTVAGSLACASAAFGSPTLLVECDLRRPSLAGRMELEGSPGLTDYVAGNAAFEDISQPLEIMSPSPAPERDGSEPVTYAGDTVVTEPLTIVTAGTPSPQPAELLHSMRLQSLFKSIRIHYKTVVLDTSPLLPVADTLELLPLADCVVLCVRSGQTTRDQARAAKAALERFPDRPTGLVVTGVRKRDAGPYGYYSYSYGQRGFSARA